MMKGNARRDGTPSAADRATNSLPTLGRSAWDRDLTPGEVKRMVAEDRGRRALLAFERKVAVVEAEARRAVDAPARPDLPTDRAKLRRWAVPAEGLWVWSDPAFDKPRGRNAALMFRFLAAVDLLRARGRRGRAGLRAELAARDRLVSDLELQVAHLVGENRALRERVARLVADAAR